VLLHYPVKYLMASGSIFCHLYYYQRNLVTTNSAHIGDVFPYLCINLAFPNNSSILPFPLTRWMPQRCPFHYLMWENLNHWGIIVWKSCDLLVSFIVITSDLLFWGKLHSEIDVYMLGLLSLSSPMLAKLSSSFGCGKGRNASFAGWWVTLCDPLWHVSSHRNVAVFISRVLQSL